MNPVVMNSRNYPGLTRTIVPGFFNQLRRSTVIFHWFLLIGAKGYRCCLGFGRCWLEVHIGIYFVVLNSVDILALV